LVGEQHLLPAMAMRLVRLEVAEMAMVMRLVRLCPVLPAMAMRLQVLWSKCHQKI